MHSDQTWLVRLDTYADPGRAAEVRHDHPTEWTDAGLRELVSRLLVQERVGLLEKKPPPQPVFSADEVAQLAPRLQQAFRMARPAEWIVFCLTRSAGASQEVTSGGFFLQDRHLHVMVANYREPVSSGQDGAETVRANPLRALKRTGRTLAFDPPTYVLASPENWTGGYAGAPASELVLDQTAFLASLKRPSIEPVATQPPPVPAPPSALPTPSTMPVAPPPAAAAEPAGADLKAQVLRLQEEVTGLRRKLDEQAQEIARLKARLAESEGAQRKRPTKKPTR